MWISEMTTKPKFVMNITSMSFGMRESEGNTIISSASLADSNDSVVTKPKIIS
jgi:hypothetical protein